MRARSAREAAKLARRSGAPDNVTPKLKETVTFKKTILGYRWEGLWKWRRNPKKTNIDPDDGGGGGSRVAA